MTTSNTAAPPPSSAPAAQGDPSQPTSRRLLSLDALRGFDMFWIVGGEELIHALYQTWPSGPLHVLDRQLTHKAWEGFAFYDLIFPMFVFIVGASLVFSLSKLLATNGKPAVLKRIAIRSIILYLFGLIVYGGISRGLDGVRWMGV